MALELPRKEWLRTFTFIGFWSLSKNPDQQDKSKIIDPLTGHNFMNRSISNEIQILKKSCPHGPWKATARRQDDARYSFKSK